MNTSHRLPRVAVKYRVISPPGGLLRKFREIDKDQRTSLDIEIEAVKGRRRYWIRVTPLNSDVIVHNPKIPVVYIITKAQAIFITHEGGEELTGYPVVDVYAEINTAVQRAGKRAGPLKTWQHPGFNTEQLGA